MERASREYQGEKSMSFSDALADGRNTKNAPHKHCGDSLCCKWEGAATSAHGINVRFGSPSLSCECQGCWLSYSGPSQVIYVLLFLMTVRADLLYCHIALPTHLSSSPLQIAWCSALPWNEICFNWWWWRITHTCLSWYPASDGFPTGKVAGKVLVFFLVVKCSAWHFEGSWYSNIAVLQNAWKTCLANFLFVILLILRILALPHDS